MRPPIAPSAKTERNNAGNLKAAKNISANTDVPSDDAIMMSRIKPNILEINVQPLKVRNLCSIDTVNVKQCGQIVM